MSRSSPLAHTHALPRSQSRWFSASFPLKLDYPVIFDCMRSDSSPVWHYTRFLDCIASRPAPRSVHHHHLPWWSMIPLPNVTIEPRVSCSYLNGVRTNNSLPPREKNADITQHSVCSIRGRVRSHRLVSGCRFRCFTGPLYLSLDTQ